MGGDAEMIERGRWQSEEKHSKMDRRPKADGMSDGAEISTKLPKARADAYRDDMYRAATRPALAWLN